MHWDVRLDSVAIGIAIGTVLISFALAKALEARPRTVQLVEVAPNGPIGHKMLYLVIENNPRWQLGLNRRVMERTKAVLHYYNMERILIHTNTYPDGSLYPQEATEPIAVGEKTVIPLAIKGDGGVMAYVIDRRLCQGGIVLDTRHLEVDEATFEGLQTTLLENRILEGVHPCFVTFSGRTFRLLIKNLGRGIKGFSCERRK